MGANDAFEEALKLEPTNAQAKSGLAAMKRAIDAEAKSLGGENNPRCGLGNMFNDPQLFQKLAGSPKTAFLLADPSFMTKLQKIRQNPNAIGEEMQDPRFLQVMGILMGIGMSFAGGGDDVPGASGTAREAEEDLPMPDAPPSYKASEPKKEPEPEPEPEPEDEDAIALKKAKEDADAEKKLGTENCKKRKFDEAIGHYSKAWELHKDVTYLTNKSAAEFERGDYEAAIKICQEAISEGREVRTDFNIIAKYTYSLSLQRHAR